MLALHTKDAICWYSSNTLSVPHGMFNRHGGTGRENFASLNLSFGVGDHRKTVLDNRDRIKQILGITHLVSSRQVHGNAVALVKQTDRDRELADYDALITNQPGVGLLIQQADCQAVLLHDPVRQIIAAIHSGWRGSVTNIIAKTIRLMQQHYSAEPVDMRAVISPSLGPCCGEFINYRQELPLPFHSFRRGENHFDFPAISRWQLRQAGIPARHIETCGICTVCSEEFFSYRRARRKGDGITGRNGSVIALPG